MGKFLGLKIFHPLWSGILFFSVGISLCKIFLKRKAPKIKTYDSNKGSFDYFPRYSTCTIFFSVAAVQVFFLLNPSPVKKITISP